MKKSNTKQNLKKAETLNKVGILSLVAALLILFITILYAQRQSKITVSALPQTPIAVNQPISIGVVDLRTSDVKTTNGQFPFMAPSNKQYIILTLTVKNRSDKPIQVLPTTDTYIKDGDGNISYLSPYALTDPLRAGQLLPGESIRGQLSYLVSKDKAVKFYVDAGWSGAVLPFALN